PGPGKMKVAASIAALVLVAGVAGAAPVRAEPIATGQRTVEADGTRLTVFTYRPSGCPDPSLLLVVHGAARDADRYRDFARPLAARHALLVAAPLLDQPRSPSGPSQRGGIVGREGGVEPPQAWTGRLVLALVEWARRQEGRPLAYSLIAHSAGGQF